MNGIFDSHAHYDAAQFDEDREELLERIHAAGVEYILTLGDNIEHSRAALALAEKYPFVYCGVGVHPSDCDKLPHGWLDILGEMAASPRVRAIGEIGLDYYWPEPDHALQPAVLEAQLGLARDLGLPVSLHDRDSHGDMLDTLRRFRPRGVLHRFSGSPEMAGEIVRLGLYLGFGGSVTYKNSKKLMAALASVPADRILVETDCPYLPPQSFRGQRCDSSMLPEVLEAMAVVKGVSPQEMSDITRANARELFGV